MCSEVLNKCLFASIAIVMFPTSFNRLSKTIYKNQQFDWHDERSSRSKSDCHLIPISFSLIKRDTVLLANQVANTVRYHLSELYIVVHGSKSSLFSMRYNDKKNPTIVRTHFCFCHEHFFSHMWRIIIIYAKLTVCHSFIPLVSWVPISIKATRAFFFSTP